jgi:hypothetical protein
MIEFFEKLFRSDFMAHGHCYFWRPEIVWLHAASDGLIAVSYYFIPVLLVYLVRKRRDLPFHWMFFMFGIFILGCGTTHVMELWTLWHGTYRLDGVIKAITAGASLATAIALVPMVPRRESSARVGQMIVVVVCPDGEAVAGVQTFRRLWRGRSRLGLIQALNARTSGFA